MERRNDVADSAKGWIHWYPGDSRTITRSSGHNPMEELSLRVSIYMKHKKIDDFCGVQRIGAPGWGGTRKGAANTRFTSLHQY
jgi:hypothetical protein